METTMTTTPQTEPKHHAIFLPFAGGGLGPRTNDESMITAAWHGINDVENRIYLLRQFPQTEAAQREWWLKPDTDKELVFVIYLGTTAIGTMGVHHIDYVHGHATTGTLIWSAEHRNQGIATKAKLVLLEYLFDTLNLRRVYSQYIDYNGRSARYSDKCGYVEVARLPGHFRFGPMLADEVTLMCERSTWLPCFAKYQSDNPTPHTREQLIAKHRAAAGK